MAGAATDMIRRYGRGPLGARVIDKAWAPDAQAFVSCSRLRSKGSAYLRNDPHRF
jgi:hypothetical protein